MYVFVVAIRDNIKYQMHACNNLNKDIGTVYYFEGQKQNCL